MANLTRRRGIPLPPKLRFAFFLAALIAVGFWIAIGRVSPPSLETPRRPAETLDASIIRDSRFERLTTPRGLELEARLRLGRTNPFAPLTPVSGAPSAGAAPSPSEEGTAVGAAPESGGAAPAAPRPPGVISTPTFEL